MIIRYLTSDDAKYFANALLHDQVGKKYLNFYGANENNLEKIKNNEWGAGFCLEVQSLKVAYILLALDAKSCDVTINNVYVIESKRQKGYATKLIEYAEKFSKDNWKNAVEINLFTIHGCNTEKFIEGLGYENRGTYKDLCGKGLHQTMWSKKL